MRAWENWKTFVAVGLTAGVLFGLYRASELAPQRDRTMPLFYDVYASRWLCIQHKWASDQGKQEAVRALGETHLAKNDPSTAESVAITQRLAKQGGALSSCR